MSKISISFWNLEFIIETDHKPLEAIFKKPRDKSPLRLQRLLINLKMYDFSVVYKPGSELYLADTLSRASKRDEFDIMEREIEAQVNLIDYISISKPQFERLIKETNGFGITRTFKYS